MFLPFILLPLFWGCEKADTAPDRKDAVSISGLSDSQTKGAADTVELLAEEEREEREEEFESLHNSFHTLLSSSFRNTRLNPAFIHLNHPEGDHNSPDFSLLPLLRAPPCSL